MIDQQLARLRTHRSNIQRYRNLLKTSLTELERQFVQKRLTEEQSNLESLATSLPDEFRGSNAGRASVNALFAGEPTVRSDCGRRGNAELE